MRRWSLALLAWLVGLAVCGAAGVGAQRAPDRLSDRSPVPPELNFARQLGESPLFGSRQESGEPLVLSGQFRVARDGHDGKLSIRAQLAPHWHTYALAQKGGPGPSKLTVEESRDFELLGPFQPDREPRSRRITDQQGRPIWDVPVLEHYGEVTWTAPIRLAEGVDPQQLEIRIRFDGQVCEDGGSCIPVLGQRVAARFAGYEASPVPAGAYRAKQSHVLFRGHLQPRIAAPGQPVQLVLTAVPDGPYHIYALADKDPKQGNKPTLIALTRTSGWKAKRPIASSQPLAGGGPEGATPRHEGPVSWTIELEVPQDARPGEYPIAGLIGYQTCTESTCDLPAAVQFEGTARVAGRSRPGTVPLAFSDFRSYRQVAAEAENMQWLSGRPVTTWQDKPVALIFGLAFLAGLILNVMPCVLPVIGLKIMSFVQQAGESRLRVLQLNLWFSLGLVAVFWVLASVPVGLSVLGKETLGWGGQFAYAPFAVTLVAVVFVFALSFLGVWEIPIPGFVGSGQASKLTEREGAGGAFAKGVLATVLATPCTGPLLGPAVGWAVVQPPWVTYAAFTCIGLGMASPYLLIGAFPRLIGLLPKPGAWMEMFKKLMGFVLLATVVWIFSFLDEAYVVPTLSLLVALGLGCWLVGRVPLTAELGPKLAAWSAAAVIVALVAILFFVHGRLVVPLVSLIVGGAMAIGLVVQTPLGAGVGRKVLGWGSAAVVLLIAFLITHFSLASVQLPWQPFSRDLLDEHRASGRTVLVDFTADW